MHLLKDKDQYLILDFDSTFIKVEALDVLADACIKGRDSAKMVDKISQITRMGMEGKMTFSKSLEQRMKVLHPEIKDLKKAVKKLEKSVTYSIERNKKFFQANADRIYIISGGFEEFIIPIVTRYGISKDKIIANRFIYKNGKIAGYDKTRPTAKDNGKSIAACSLKLGGKIIVLGDGITDFEIARQLEKSHFIAFTENVIREKVVSLAEFAARSFDEVIDYIESKVK